MSRSAALLLVLGSALAFPSPLRAEEAADVAAEVEKGVKAYNAREIAYYEAAAAARRRRSSPTTARSSRARSA